MMRDLSLLIFLMLFLFSANAEESKNIDSYIVDVTAGAVSAGSLIGVSKTAITEVQTSQDLVVALQPITSSSSSSKDGFGLAITPFRTTILPMDQKTYLRNPFTRALGALTFSYAENASTVGSVKYRKNAWSIDTSAFWDKESDPVYIGQHAADTGSLCNTKTIELGSYAGRRQDDWEAAQTELKRLNDAPNVTDEKEKTEQAAARIKASKAVADAEIVFTKASDAAVGYLVKCVQGEIDKVKWNAGRWQFSAGGTWARPDDGTGSRKKTGTYATFNALFPAGASGAIYLSARRTWNELDMKTFGISKPVQKNASLAAARYTYGSQNQDTNLKALAEVSNAKSDLQTSTNALFKYAVGLDMRLTKGIWLEFRLGKARTVDNGSLETTGLLNLNVGVGSLASLLSGKK